MSDRFQMKVATSVIVIVLTVQAVAILARSGKWAWPFIDYPMYASSHYEGERIPARHTVYGITADGHQLELTRNNIGVNLWLFEKWAGQMTAAQLGAGMPDRAKRHRDGWALEHWLRSSTFFQWLKGKQDPDLTPLFLDLFEKKNGTKLVKLRIEDAAVVVTRDGVAEAPANVVLLDLPPRNQPVNSTSLGDR
jgi:hypothetical protein